MKKQKIGIICMTLGAALMCGALVLLLYNKWEEQQAEDAASQIVAILGEQIEENRNSASYPSYSQINNIDEQAAEDGDTDEETDEVEEEMATASIDGYEYIGVLSVSKFGLELPVMSEWSYPGLKIAPGRYSGSTYTDNLVICGHNYERHFGQLKNLEAGDSIIFTDVNGNELKYEVAEVIILQPTAVDEMLSRESCEWDLTLFTCTYGGRTRVTVRCVKVD
ncbi:MAG: sortase [Clostridiales bacterium]|nr:sortase [Clostridiales bacterium]